MNTSRDRARGWVGLVLREIHFWAPVAVLIAGLLVLRWIS
jgi:hypothetical protein